MQRKGSDEQMRGRRWEDFRQRAKLAPQTVYRHRANGWEYIPMHPFGDELDLLEHLSLAPEDCRHVDAWWGIEGDATLLEGSVGAPSALFATGTRHWERSVYVTAVFDAAYVTRAAFEEAMSRFAGAGFPKDLRFRLREGDHPVQVL